MTKIGIVDIDTSHPAAWISIERELGFEVVGFHDHSLVHPPEVARGFATEHRLRQFTSLEELVAASDIGIIHSCNWDTHLAKVEPFLRAGKAVFIDKPLAGRWPDLQALLEWERRGARLTGGSCNLYAREIQNYLKRTSVAEKTRAHTVMGGCGVDEFNYGIHAFSSAFGVLGFDCVRVRTADEGRLRVTHLVWRNGSQAVLTFGQHPWVQSHLTLIAEKSLEHIRLDIADIYRPMLEATLPYLAGRRAAPEISLTNLIEPELAALASARSLVENGRWVELAEIRQGAGPAYDGVAFNEFYRQQRYPRSQLG